MVDEAGELKLPWGFYKEDWQVFGAAWGQPNKAHHTERANEKVEKQGDEIKD